MGDMFHPFPRLPLELRQIIWELSMEPRKVIVARSDDPDPEHTPPPPPLHACAESRFHLQKYYTKAFLRSVDDDGLSQYDWVRFNVDTIYLDEQDLELFESEVTTMVRHLIVESNNARFFNSDYCDPLLQTKALETLTIIDTENNGVHYVWWWAWCPLMKRLYGGDEAVAFDTKIVSSIDDEPHFQEPFGPITRYNYEEAEHDWIEQMMDRREVLRELGE